MDTTHYHVLDLIGEGSYGKVYKGRRKYTGQVCLLCLSSSSCHAYVILIRYSLRRWYSSGSRTSHGYLSGSTSTRDGPHRLRWQTTQKNYSVSST